MGAGQWNVCWPRECVLAKGMCVGPMECMPIIVGSEWNLVCSVVVMGNMALSQAEESQQPTETIGTYLQSCLWILCVRELK